VSARFKLDENLARDIKVELRTTGHDVRTAIAQGLGGSQDSDLLHACRVEQRILVTLDLDFADVCTYPPQDQPGIWVLRPATQSVEATLAVLRSAVELVRSEPVAQTLWIVQPGRVRVRH
jgi:predicted nuclease of predicted toxin-antitoxin system